MEVKKISLTLPILRAIAKNGDLATHLKQIQAKANATSIEKLDSERETVCLLTKHTRNPKLAIVIASKHFGQTPTQFTEAHGDSLLTDELDFVALHKIDDECKATLKLLFDELKINTDEITKALEISNEDIYNALICFMNGSLLENILNLRKTIKGACELIGDEYRKDVQRGVYIESELEEKVDGIVQSFENLNLVNISKELKEFKDFLSGIFKKLHTEDTEDKTAEKGNLKYFTEPLNNLLAHLLIANKVSAYI